MSQHSGNDSFSPFPSARRIPDTESPVRRLYSDAHNLPYHPLSALEEAKAYSDGIVILEGDDGGQIYATVPAADVACSEVTLRHLLDQLDEIEWSSGDGCGARVFYERRPAGSGVPGGMGGGAVTGTLWLHPRLVGKELLPIVRDVLDGALSEIPLAVMHTHVQREPDEGVTLHADEFRARMVAAINRTAEKAQQGVAESLPRAYHFNLGLFRQCGKACLATFDEALAHLYLDAAFPPSVTVSVGGIWNGLTLVSLTPSGRYRVQRLRDDKYREGITPFFPHGLVPVAKRRDQPPVSLAHLEQVATYLLSEQLPAQLP